ncbi:MAG: hypothetical protein WKF82_09140 [Nocardioidaceae bacterium]
MITRVSSSPTTVNISIRCLRAASLSSPARAAYKLDQAIKRVFDLPTQQIEVGRESLSGHVVWPLGSRLARRSDIFTLSPLEQLRLSKSEVRLVITGRRLKVPR